MIRFLKNEPDSISPDVCIIGAGAAGITLARELARHSLNVVLCEAGSLDFSDQSQSNYQGTIAGDDYHELDICRLRFFGGTTNHWAGYCRPMNPYDFEAKNGNPLMAWPISAADLAPYKSEARRILELPDIAEDQPLGRSGLNRFGYSFSPPVRFGEKYRKELENDKNVKVILNANLTGIEAESGTITEMQFQDYSKNTRKVRAKCFVMACGGIENSRLLEWFNKTGESQFVENPSLIGRYWMEHPKTPVGECVLLKPEAFTFDEHATDYFTPNFEFMQANNILGCELQLQSQYYGDAKETIANLICVAPSLAEWVSRQFNKKLTCVVKLDAVVEQEPSSENRVTLGAEKDMFGIPQPVLHWTKSRLVRDTVRKTAITFAKHCAREGIARIRLDPPWLDDEGAFPKSDDMAGNHHMGGTRMASSSETGVVDADCRVFGSNNLFMAGSSVFPSGGYMPPTYTIVQLSLRLADHLKTFLAKSG